MPSLSASDCVRLNLIVTGPMHAIMPATMLAIMQAFEDYQRGRFLMEECTYKLHTKAGTVVSKRKIEDSYRRGR